MSLPAKDLSRWTLTEIAAVEGRGTWSVRLSLSVGKNEDELYMRWKARSLRNSTVLQQDMAIGRGLFLSTWKVDLPSFAYVKSATLFKAPPLGLDPPHRARSVRK
jgi:hypothetical protein